MNLLDMRVRDFLEEYCTVENLECGGIYGVAKYEDVESVYKEYDFPEDDLSFCAEPIIPDTIDLEEDPLDKDALHRICECIGVDKK